MKINFSNKKILVTGGAGFIGSNLCEVLLNKNNKVVCLDNFVTGKVPLNIDVVDMEAYALAKVCKLEDINFKCFKFISDNADKNASKDWVKNNEKGAELFKHKLKDLP